MQVTRLHLLIIDKKITLYTAILSLGSVWVADTAKEFGHACFSRRVPPVLMVHMDPREKLANR